MYLKFDTWLFRVENFKHKILGGEEKHVAVSWFKNSFAQDFWRNKYGKGEGYLGGLDRKHDEDGYNQELVGQGENARSGL